MQIPYVPTARSGEQFQQFVYLLKSVVKMHLFVCFSLDYGVQKMEPPFRTIAAQQGLFIEQMPAHVVVFDIEMRYLAVSCRFLSDMAFLFSTKVFTPAEVIGRSHYEIFPDMPPHWHEIHARVLAGEEVAQGEDFVPRRDGRADWARWSMKPWRTAEGRIGGALLFSEVITEHVEARQALVESEARFRATFENAAVGIAHIAADLRWLRANEALSRILGYSRDELPGKSLLDITYPDDLPASLAFLEGMRSGEVDNYELHKRYIRKDRAIVWVGLSVSCVRGSDGSIDYFVCIIEDISARKHAEERQNLLIAELDHRVKNVLARVTAVVRHTSCRGTKEEFVKSLEGRIRSIADAHSLLSKSRWGAVSLADLTRRQLAPYTTGTNTSIDGPDIMLAAREIQALAVVFHELVTNAAKYGALSDPNGSVSVRWALSEADSATLVITWCERGGPSAAGPAHCSYGTSLIRHLIPHEIGGTVDLTFSSDGTCCNIEIPLKSRNVPHTTMLDPISESAKPISGSSA
jgi:PAS domain S-box-containing protein